MKNNLILLSAIWLLTTSLVAQVSINNPNPNPHSILDLSDPATDKELLMPPKAKLKLIASTALAGNGNENKGLLMFDDSTSSYYFFDGAKWQNMTPFKAEYDKTTNAVAKVSTDKILEVTNKVSNPSVGNTTTITGSNVNTYSATLNQLIVSGFPTNALVPKGAIMMWSGTTAPSGWALCDGTTVNGVITPNLRGRFVIGYDINETAYNYNSIGATGGANSIALTVDQMPRHNHGGATYGGGGHQHTTRFRKGDIQLDGGKAGGLIQTNDDDGWQGQLDNDNTYYTNSAGTHEHSIYPQGWNAPVDNRPPYYVLAYIIKL